MGRANNYIMEGSSHLNGCKSLHKNLMLVADGKLDMNDLEPNRSESEGG